MDAISKGNQPASEEIARQQLQAAPDRNGEARASETEPETTAPLCRDYGALTGRGVPRLPAVRQPAGPSQRDYSALTGRT
jgi:hypothetical protein